MKIVYDAKLKRPACVLLQVVLGGDSHTANRFKPEYWLVNPTENMHIYETTEAQLKQLVVITENEPVPTDHR